MGVSIRILMAIFLVVAFLAYQFRVEGVVLSSPSVPGGVISGPGCSSVTSAFADEWKEKCKDICSTSACLNDLDNQKTIKWCKPNSACLTKHGKNSIDEVTYECEVTQNVDSLKYSAYLKCDDVCSSTRGGGTPLDHCGCTAVVSQ